MLSAAACTFGQLRLLVLVEYWILATECGVVNTNLIPDTVTLARHDGLDSLFGTSQEHVDLLELAPDLTELYF